MKAYDTLYKIHREQTLDTVFAHFYPITFGDEKDWDEPYKLVARQTLDGIDAWAFHQDRFKAKHSGSAVPKLKNYLNYTFKRLLEIERLQPGRFFVHSADGEWVTFNSGLQNLHAVDLLAVFQRYKARPEAAERVYPDWVFKGCYTPTDRKYRDHFGTKVADIAWYSLDSKDFIFDVTYTLERDVFDHLFERAKERAGLPGQSDEVVRNYLRGALENLLPKIKRNYKIAIPVYYVEERRMQLLLPFSSAGNSNEMSAFLVERDDATRTYHLKTIFDLDQAYFSARLITRPDKDWLNP
jgi:hypothetical protein